MIEPGTKLGLYEILAPLGAGGMGEVANGETLFDVHPANPPDYHYDVTTNGKRFLVDTTKEGNTAPVALIVNWTADLKR